MGKIILASSSPRRADILKTNNIKFEICPSPYVEDHSVTDFSYEFVEELAFCKANAVLPLIQGSAQVIGSDTVVVLDGKILGKPKDANDAFLMLKRLSGRVHQVVTSIVVINSETGNVRKNSTTSVVEFEKLTDALILDYINIFKPFDKAGSYGIQEMPAGYIKGYEGSFENIMGICPKALLELLY